MKTFQDILNEGSIGFEGYSFVVAPVEGPRGLSITFIPDGKTLETPKKVLAAAIEKKLQELKPFHKCFQYDPNSHAAGVVFQINSHELIDAISFSLRFK